MKIIYNILILFLISQLGFSQGGKVINGRVLCDGIPVEGVEVVNYSSKAQTKTDAYGVFQIEANVGDILVIITEKYEYKKIYLKEGDLKSDLFKITIEKKPEELDEVLVSNMSIQHVSLDQKTSVQLAIEKDFYTLKNEEVYTGAIDNGTDFVKIGQMIGGLFAKEKENPKIEKSKIEFKTLATEKVAKSYYTNNLQLKPEDVPLFLQFCDSDPKLSERMENINELALMDYLLEKSVEFKKIANTPINQIKTN